MKCCKNSLEILKEDATLLAQEYEKTLEQLRGAKILVTGSTGMIGSYLCKILLFWADEFDLEVYLHCRDAVKAERIFYPFLRNKRGHLVQFDLMQQIPGNLLCDYIIHTASPAGSYYFTNYPLEVMEPNIFVTWRLLEYAKLSNAKFLFCSSSSIYGEIGHSSDVLSEKDYGIVDPLSQRACYIESKRCAEQMCIAFAHEHSVQAYIVRISHTYGPTFDIENDNRVIPRSIKKLVLNEDIELYADPESLVQYTYVGDICSGIISVMSRGVAGEAYNVCGNQALPLPMIVKYMLDGAHSTSKLIETPIDREYVFEKRNGSNLKKMDNQKLKQLGWKPLFNAQNGFNRTIKAYITDKPK